MASTYSTDMVARHIQNMSEAQILERHWGYADRALPCTNDPGSCAYLDAIYHSIDLGMLYTFILWAAIGGILFIWAMGRRLLPTHVSDPRRRPDEATAAKQGSVDSCRKAVFSFLRKHLLPESPTLRPVFGHVTRLQLLILAILTGYLTVFTFIGLVYQTWVTPVKNNPSVYNIRTGLGAFANRVGVLAYAITPLSILLASRESVLSLLTGLPYQSFNFLHRWLGYIIYAQSTLHTIGWVVVEGRLYQPQPKVWTEFIEQKYMIWGVVAMVLLSLIFLLSLSCMVKLTGYEIWRKTHYILAMLYVGACWGHWSKLSCWLIASLTVWLVDRGARLVRVGLLHYQFLGSTSSMGFRYIEAECQVFPDEVNGDVVRLQFDHNHGPWKVGQHFYLTFVAGGIWQSHPFTPASLPSSVGVQNHVYVFRAKAGETRRVAQMVKFARMTTSNPSANKTAIILAGPYGEGTMNLRITSGNANVLCIAGGTGITFALPVLNKLMSTPTTCNCERKLELIWAIRKKSDMQWLYAELEMFQEVSKKTRASLTIRIFVTRDSSAKPTAHEKILTEKPDFTKVQDDEIFTSSPSSSSQEEISCTPPQKDIFSIQQATPAAALQPETRHPDLTYLVTNFVESTVKGPTQVFASGPSGMMTDLRRIVAGCNEHTKVIKGDGRGDVRFVGDDRMEW